MYKKITHNIVEEHYDHPMAMKMKEASWPIPPAKWMYVSNLRSQFISFTEDLRSYIKSEMSDASDNPYNWERLITTTNQFAPFFSQYIGQANAQSIVTHFTDYINSISAIAKAAKAGQDYSSLKESSLASLLAVIEVLNTAMPDWWTPMSVSAAYYMMDYNRSTIEQIVARKALDWASDYKAADLALMVIATGATQAPYTGLLSFSDILANGIIRNFSSQFG